ncbi:MAG: hypothetical protein ACRD0U_02070 [Acidimicrobiales bacterium]
MADLLTPDLTERLEHFAADARASEVAGARARQRWLRRAAHEEANVRGLLLDLAEGGTPVVLHTVTGRRLRATVRTVGADFVTLWADSGTETLVAIWAVTSIRSERTAAPTGDRHVEIMLTLAETVAALAGDQPRVLVVTGPGPGGHIAGQLSSVGRDVLVLRPDGEARARTFVPIGAVAELVVVQ